MSPLAVLDWRRRVHALYAEVRAAPDPRSAHERWRAGRDQLFASHPASPLPPERARDFTGLRYGDYEPALRFDVDVDAEVEPQRVEVATGTDGVVAFDRVGVVRLPGVGELDLWWLGSYGGGVFLPVRDGLAGQATYGGGRYLLDTVKGADLGGGTRGGSLVVDLNFAYNPSCAYDPAWQCPLAQPGNVVTAELSVGELIG